MNKLKTIIVFCCCLCIGSTIYGQVRVIGAGIKPGGGHITGSAAATTSLYAAPFVDIRETLVGDGTLRVQAVYAKDMDAVFGPSRSYYPYVYGGSLQIYEQSPIAPTAGIEYGFGILVLSDHTYSDMNKLSMGFLMNAGVWFAASSGVQIGAGGEYGQTFSTNNPGYFMYFAQLRFLL